MLKYKINDCVLFEEDDIEYIGFIYDVKNGKYRISVDFSFDADEFYADITVSDENIIRTLPKIKSTYEQLKEHYPELLI